VTRAARRFVILLSTALLVLGTGVAARASTPTDPPQHKAAVCAGVVAIDLGVCL
jgi:hypothetical protein